jgi:hypothetical protein
MKNRTLTILTAIIVVSSAHSQAVWTVDNNPISGAQFTSVQEAINAAEPGDYIYVHPSPDAYENITINKTIHIRGIGHGPALNDGTNAFVEVINLSAQNGAPNSSISGMNISKIDVSGNFNQDYTGWQITNNRITGWIHGDADPNMCDNWLFQGNVCSMGLNDAIDQENNNNWMFVNNYFSTSTGQLLYNLFHNFNATTEFRNNVVATNQNVADNIALFDNSDNVTVENSIFIFISNNPTGMTGGDGEVNFYNCLTYSYGGGTLADLPGANNLNNTDPMFVDGGSNAYFDYIEDYHLQGASPGVGFGTDGQDIGVYGNGQEFPMEGYPMDLPYPTQMLINMTQVTNGGTLEIEFKAKGN